MKPFKKLETGWAVYAYKNIEGHKGKYLGKVTRPDGKVVPGFHPSDLQWAWVIKNKSEAIKKMDELNKAYGINPRIHAEARAFRITKVRRLVEQ